MPIFVILNIINELLITDLINKGSPFWEPLFGNPLQAPFAGTLFRKPSSKLLLDIREPLLSSCWVSRNVAMWGYNVEK